MNSLDDVSPIGDTRGSSQQRHADGMCVLSSQGSTQ